MSQFSRTENLIGADAQNKLHGCHVAVFGLGGVGSYTVEALARAGIGTLTLVDCDVVEQTNINRQLFALHSTLGKPKTEVAKARILDVNPNAVVNALNCRFDQTTLPLFDFSSFDYVVDAIDTVTSKLLLAEVCHNCGTPIVSCMGTGNKLHADFSVADISQTSVCPLAKVMRRELRKRGIQHLKVVYSQELPHKQYSEEERPAPSSISFVPPVAGMLLAQVVVCDLLDI